jgi:hypothetical protein
MARIAVGPHGDIWEVRRLWLPRLRKERSDGTDSEDDDDDAGWWTSTDLVGGELAELLSVAAVVLAIFVAVFFLLPYVFFVLELLAVPVLFLYRVALGRPWTVEARREDARRPQFRWKVVGWRRSGEVVDEVADALERGEREPRPVGAKLVTASDHE